MYKMNEKRKKRLHRQRIKEITYEKKKKKESNTEIEKVKKECNFFLEC